MRAAAERRTVAEPAAVPEAEPVHLAAAAAGRPDAALPDALDEETTLDEVAAALLLDVLTAAHDDRALRRAEPESLRRSGEGSPELI